MIDIDLETITASVGETVSGQITWDPTQNAPKGVVIEFGFHTEGRGSADRGVVAGLERTFEGDPTTTPPWVRFEFLVPDDAPVSYDGNLIRVIWWVEATLDVAWARDPKVREIIHVLPKM